MTAAPGRTKNRHGEGERRPGFGFGWKLKAARKYANDQGAQAVDLEFAAHDAGVVAGICVQNAR